jgi:hypothetical protein
MKLFHVVLCELLKGIARIKGTKSEAWKNVSSFPHFSHLKVPLVSIITGVF